MPEPVDAGKPVWKLLQSYLWWPVRSWLSIAVGVTLLRILLTYMLSSLSMSDFSRRLLSSVTCSIASCNFATVAMFCFFILRHIILALLRAVVSNSRAFVISAFFCFSFLSSSLSLEEVCCEMRLLLFCLSRCARMCPRRVFLRLVTVCKLLIFLF